MALQVSGECKVYNIKTKEKSVMAGLGISTKDKDGSWKTEFIQGMFVKDAIEKAKKLEARDKINIVTGTLGINTVEKDGKKTTYYSVIVFDFVNLSQGEEFVPVDIDPEDVPF